MPRVHSRIRIASNSANVYHVSLGHALLVRMLHNSPFFVGARYEGNGVVVAGSFGCDDCDAGKFANSPGLLACEPCAAGSYANETGSINCDLCGIG